MQMAGGVGVGQPAGLFLVRPGCGWRLCPAHDCQLGAAEGLYAAPQQGSISSPCQWRAQLHVLSKAPAALRPLCLCCSKLSALAAEPSEEQQPSEAGPKRGRPPLPFFLKVRAEQEPLQGCCCPEFYATGDGLVA